MIDLKLDIDSVPLAREISDIQRKQIPFALMLAQTRLATNRIKPGIAQVMAQRLDRPTPTTQRSLFAQAATKSRGAKVWFKDQWTTGIPADTYLQQAVQGGARPHKRFEKSLIAQGLMKSGQYAVPNPDLLNQYGNVSRGVMTRILSGLGAAEGGRGYQANATGSSRSTRPPRRRGSGTRAGSMRWRNAATWSASPARSTAAAMAWPTARRCGRRPARCWAYDRPGRAPGAVGAAARPGRRRSRRLAVAGERLRPAAGHPGGRLRHRT
ncbi:hypothetical protein GCM10011247_08680 [Pseudomonas plecoglossicida]|nr:hypothetical protein GCM10011247_08680 [Pseudomonas plecoglossicida]